MASSIRKVSGRSLPREPALILETLRIRPRLQTLGTIRANSQQREQDITNLEAMSHSTDPAQHTEMATLQRINQALLIELRSQQEANQMLQAQAMQQMIGQKVQQDNLKSLFQTGSTYQQNYNSIAPQTSTAGTQWAFHY